MRKFYSLIFGSLLATKSAIGIKANTEENVQISFRDKVKTKVKSSFGGVSRRSLTSPHISRCWRANKRGSSSKCDSICGRFAHWPVPLNYSRSDTSPITTNSDVHCAIIIAGNVLRKSDFMFMFNVSLSVRSRWKLESAFGNCSVIAMPSVLLYLRFIRVIVSIARSCEARLNWIYWSDYARPGWVTIEEVPNFFSHRLRSSSHVAKTKIRATKEVKK